MAKAPASEPVKLLTIEKVAELADVCTKTVRNEINKKNLGYVKIGNAIRVRIDQYNDWIRRQTQDAKF